MPPPPSQAPLATLVPSPLHSAEAQARLKALGKPWTSLGADSSALRFVRCQSMAGQPVCLSLNPLLRLMGYDSKNLSSAVSKVDKSNAKWVDEQSSPYASFDECKEALTPTLRVEGDTPATPRTSRYLTRQGCDFLVKVLGEWDVTRQPLKTFAEHRSRLLRLLFDEPDAKGGDASESDASAASGSSDGEPDSDSDAESPHRSSSTPARSNTSSRRSSRGDVTSRKASGSMQSQHVSKAVKSATPPPALSAAELRRQRAAERAQRGEAAAASDRDQSPDMEAYMDPAQATPASHSSHAASEAQESKQQAQDHVSVSAAAQPIMPPSAPSPQQCASVVPPTALPPPEAALELGDSANASAPILPALAPPSPAPSAPLSSTSFGFPDLVRQHAHALAADPRADTVRATIAALQALLPREGADGVQRASEAQHSSPAAAASAAATPAKRSAASAIPVSPPSAASAAKRTRLSAAAAAGAATGAARSLLSVPPPDLAARPMLSSTGVSASGHPVVHVTVLAPSQLYVAFAQDPERVVAGKVARDKSDEDEGDEEDEDMDE